MTERLNWKKSTGTEWTAKKMNAIYLEYIKVQDFFYTHYDRCEHGQNTLLNPTKHCTVPFLNGGKIQYSV
jgi:hypothetical protein